MKILIINNGTRVFHNFTRMLSEHEVVTVKRLEAGLAKTELFNAIILTGSSNYSLEWYKETYKSEEDIIRTSSTPILGICLGFELICDVYGVRPLRHNKRVVGIKKITLTKKSDLMFQSLQSPAVYQNHVYRVEAVPDDFELLAYSESGIEAIKHRSRILYGVQFHPEVYPNRTDGSIIMKNFLEMAAQAANVNKQS